MSTKGGRPIQALVLVGGQGTRLRPLTLDTPKPMLPIAERPIIARILDWLAAFGATRAVLSLGYRPEPFIEAFPEGAIHGVELSYAVEPEPLDTAGAIRFAAADAGLLEHRVVVLNGDILTDLDLDELISFHDSRSASATIALTPVEDPSTYGVVTTDERGRVLAFLEKPTSEQAPSNLINAGIYILEPDALAAIPAGRRVSIEREIFPRLAARGALFAMASDAYWIDTGTPERYRQAQLDLLRGLRPGLELPASEQVRPGRFFAPGARVLGETEGAVFVGAGATVAAGARVVDSLIGPGAVIEAGAVVENSVVLAGAHIGAAALVRASIVGPGATIGARATLCGDTIVRGHGAVAADARLDGARHGG